MILKYNDYKLNNFIVFERVSFAPPFKPSVTYDKEACFIYSLHGNSISYGGVEKDVIDSGDGILMKCGSFINSWQNKMAGSPCEIIAIHITPVILNQIYDDQVPDFLKLGRLKSKKIFQRVPQTTVIDEFIKGLIFYFDNPELINEELMMLKIKELILLLYNIDYENIRELLSSLFTPVDHAFKSIIEAHLYEELEIADYAALTSTSLSTFKRKFKKTFNLPPAHFIINKRLEKAKSLLKKTRLRITEICFDCGFKDLSTFSRSFTKKYGLSPSAYRNTQ
ncbi:MAG: AraC family transcriptional regulator [Bacteroidota bacterium]